MDGLQRHQPHDEGAVIQRPKKRGFLLRTLSFERKKRDTSSTHRKETTHNTSGPVTDKPHLNHCDGSGMLAKPPAPTSKKKTLCKDYKGNRNFVAKREPLNELSAGADKRSGNGIRPQHEPVCPQTDSPTPQYDNRSNVKLSRKPSIRSLLSTLREDSGSLPKDKSNNNSSNRRLLQGRHDVEMPSHNKESSLKKTRRKLAVVGLFGFGITDNKEGLNTYKSYADSGDSITGSTQSITNCDGSFSSSPTAIKTPRDTINKKEAPTHHSYAIESYDCEPKRLGTCTRSSLRKSSKENACPNTQTMWSDTTTHLPKMVGGHQSRANSRLGLNEKNSSGGSLSSNSNLYRTKDRSTSSTRISLNTSRTDSSPRKSSLVKNDNMNQNNALTVNLSACSSFSRGKARNSTQSYRSGGKSGIPVIGRPTSPEPQSLPFVPGSSSTSEPSHRRSSIRGTKSSELSSNALKKDKFDSRTSLRRSRIPSPFSTVRVPEGQSSSKFQRGTAVTESNKNCVTTLSSVNGSILSESCSDFEKPVQLSNSQTFSKTTVADMLLDPNKQKDNTVFAERKNLNQRANNIQTAKKSNLRQNNNNKAKLRKVSVRFVDQDESIHSIQNSNYSLTDGSAPVICSSSGTNPSTNVQGNFKLFSSNYKKTLNNYNSGSSVQPPSILKSSLKCPVQQVSSSDLCKFGPTLDSNTANTNAADILFKEIIYSDTTVLPQTTDSGYNGSLNPVTCTTNVSSTSKVSLTDVHKPSLYVPDSNPLDTTPVSSPDSLAYARSIANSSLGTPLEEHCQEMQPSSLYSVPKKRKSSERNKEGVSDSCSSKKRISGYGKDFLRDYVNFEFFQKSSREELDTGDALISANNKEISNRPPDRLSQVFLQDSNAIDDVPCTTANDTPDVALHSSVSDLSVDASSDMFLKDNLDLESQQRLSPSLSNTKRWWRMKNVPASFNPVQPGHRTSLNNLVEEYCGDLSLLTSTLSPSFQSPPDEPTIDCSGVVEEGLGFSAECPLEETDVSYEKEPFKGLGFFENLILRERFDDDFLRSRDSGGRVTSCELESSLHLSEFEGMDNESLNSTEEDDDASREDEQLIMERLMMDYDIPKPACRELPLDRYNCLHLKTWCGTVYFHL